MHDAIINQNPDTVTYNYNIWNDDTGAEWTDTTYTNRPASDLDDLTMSFSFQTGPLLNSSATTNLPLLAGDANPGPTTTAFVANYPTNTLNNNPAPVYPASELHSELGSPTGSFASAIRWRTPGGFGPPLGTSSDIK